MKKRNILFAVTVAAALSVLSANPVYAEESESISKETYDQMIEVLKDQIRDGDLDTEEDVRESIKKAEEEYGVEFSSGEEERIVGIMNTVNSLGLDKNQLVEKVDEVYKSMEGDLDGNMEEAIDKAVDEAKQQLIEEAAEQVESAAKRTILDYIKDFRIHLGKLFSKILGISVG
jgi:uncharacterized protein YpuA (DUF1002 family)